MKRCGRKRATRDDAQSVIGPTQSRRKTIYLDMMKVCSRRELRTPVTKRSRRHLLLVLDATALGDHDTLQGVQTDSEKIKAIYTSFFGGQAYKTGPDQTFLVGTAVIAPTEANPEPRISLRKVAKIAVFEPRPTEARTFIFLYDLTPMLLKWPKENSKKAAPRR